MAAHDPNFVYGPKVPYVQMIPEGNLRPSSAVLFKGLVSGTGKEGFAINVCCGLLVDGEQRDNVALHLNVRLKERAVVLNTLVNNAWGSEVRPGKFPFKKGDAFTIRLLALTHEFKISVNGSHFANYAHRLALAETKTVFVKGDVTLDLVQFEPARDHAAPGFVQAPSAPPVGLAAPGYSGPGTLAAAPSAPIYKPPVPFRRPLALRPHQQIYLTAQPLPRAGQFAINFIAGPHTAFHFNARFSDGVVVRNCCRAGQWEAEERQAPPFPFKKGGTFDLIVLVDYEGFKVAVNGQHFVAFAHRLPFQDVDNMEVIGDLTLAQVHIQ